MGQTPGPRETAPAALPTGPGRTADEAGGAPPKATVATAARDAPVPGPAGTAPPVARVGVVPGLRAGAAQGAVLTIGVATAAGGAETKRTAAASTRPFVGWRAPAPTSGQAAQLATRAEQVAAGVTVAAAVAVEGGAPRPAQGAAVVVEAAGRDARAITGAHAAPLATAIAAPVGATTVGGRRGNVKGGG